MEETQSSDYVGFGLRVWAWLIDIVAFIFFSVPLLYAIHGRDYLKSTVTVRGSLDLLNNVVFPSLALLLFWATCSATPGKMAISAKIVDARTGKKPTLVQFVIRYLGYYLSAIPLGLGFLWVLFDRRKQGWHDKLAHTVVKRVKK